MTSKNFKSSIPHWEIVRNEDRESEIELIKNIIEELREKKIKFYVPHSYYFINDGTGYLIDSSSTKKRAISIKEYLKNGENCHHILTSHYHPDHWVNNGLVVHKNSKIFLHHDARDKFEKGFYRWLYTYVDSLFENFDIKDFLMRVFRFNKPTQKIANFIIDKIEPFAKLLFIIMNFKFVGIPSSGKKRFVYLENDSKKVFMFNSVSMNGWEINDNLLALETPGHSFDHLAFYLKDRKVLFSGEVDVFLNPNNSFDTPLSLIEDTTNALINLIETEKIEVLLPSHYEPILGTSNIIQHLNHQKNKMQHCKEKMSAIINQKKEWQWHDLMATIYKSKEPIIREAISINWPKTMSNCDIYVFFLMKYLGYSLSNSLTKSWVYNDSII